MNAEDRRRLASETPKFRGNWSPSLPNPTLRSFVPVQSHYEVKRKPAQQQKAPPKPVEVPKGLIRKEDKITLQPKNILFILIFYFIFYFIIIILKLFFVELQEVAPPSDALLNILDRRRDLRSFIMKGIHPPPPPGPFSSPWFLSL